MKIKKRKELNEGKINKIKEQIIEEIIRDKHNERCFDCQKLNPDLISLYNGIFICKECARTIHSQLNNDINLIIDNDMEKLSLKGIGYLYYGGNKKLSDFIKYEYPLLKSINKNKFYLTKAMNYYRHWLKYLINGGNKPVKPSYEECYNVYLKDNKANKKEKETTKRKSNLNINNYFDYKKPNNFRKLNYIRKKEEEIYLIDNNKGHNNIRIKTLQQDNNNNYFDLSDNNPINNLDLTNYRKINSYKYKKNFTFNKSLINHEKKKIYSKPNLLISSFFQKDLDSPVKKSNKNEFNIHNSIIFPNSNNNYILFNKSTYNSPLMNTFYVGSPLSKDDLFNKTNNQNLHNKYFDSYNLANRTLKTFKENLNKSELIFKKKNLKNSFSLSRKNKNKNKKIFFNNTDNISIIEGNSFQIIPNLKKKNIKRKFNALLIKEKQKNAEDENEFTFYNLTDIRKKEIPKVEVKVNNDIQQINKCNQKLNIKELLNLIIKIKNKHKVIPKTDYIKNITKNEKIRNLKREIKEIKINLPKNQEK